ncbi:hypothetical protein DSL72_008228 [Monilinia vaccinii-corymbosi]|uniref:Uncharacterized protein n=1 Tax=Monilinia vaccinii-corymbosi TaxID=61207 RepID=A0A8A3PJ96_9HELO|nr:hypothetical protein DSL72_008228 [Monilinia vaccinii-corymbosi]
MSTSNPDPAPFFRPSKKRKIYRQRNNDDEDRDGVGQSISAPAPKAAPVAAEQSLDELIASNSAPIKKEEDGDEPKFEEAVDMAEILRLRKQRKKIGGVEFRAESQIREANQFDGNANEDAPVKCEERDTEEVPPEGGLSMRRFAPQMGVVGSGIDKHMMAYIESKLGHHSSSSNSPFARNPQVEGSRNESGQQIKEPQRAPTTMGQLLEIDLGEEARVRNAHRTELARRKAAGESIDLEESAQPPLKPRLGRDGKPWRGRKRRGSDDIQRDALVDAILHENRLEIYEPISSSSSKQTEGLANDDTIAETFRKDWEEASSHALLQRQQQMSERAAKEKKKAGQEKTEEELYMKGPKLGGSRSARAAMREAMLKGKKRPGGRG